MFLTEVNLNKKNDIDVDHNKSESTVIPENRTSNESENTEGRKSKRQTRKPDFFFGQVVNSDTRKKRESKKAKERKPKN